MTLPLYSEEFPEFHHSWVNSYIELRGTGSFVCCAARIVTLLTLACLMLLQKTGGNNALSLCDQLEAQDSSKHASSLCRAKQRF
jgi:hypothetical protein